MIGQKSPDSQNVWSKIREYTYSARRFSCVDDEWAIGSTLGFRLRFSGGHSKWHTGSCVWIVGSESFECLDFCQTKVLCDCDF